MQYSTASIAFSTIVTTSFGRRSIATKCCRATLSSACVTSAVRFALRTASRSSEACLSSDHVHMFVSVPPKLAISDLMRLMKGRSSHKVQREFPHLKKRYWGRHFWGRGYFSTTNGAITEDIVLQYLEQHIANPTDASR